MQHAFRATLRGVRGTTQEELQEFATATPETRAFLTVRMADEQARAQGRHPPTSADLARIAAEAHAFAAALDQLAEARALVERREAGAAPAVTVDDLLSAADAPEPDRCDCGLPVDEYGIHASPCLDHKSPSPMAVEDLLSSIPCERCVTAGTLAPRSATTTVRDIQGHERHVCDPCVLAHRRYLEVVKDMARRNAQRVFGGSIAEAVSEEQDRR